MELRGQKGELLHHTTYHPIVNPYRKRLTLHSEILEAYFTTPVGGNKNFT